MGDLIKCRRFSNRIKCEYRFQIFIFQFLGKSVAFFGHYGGYVDLYIDRVCPSGYIGLIGYMIKVRSAHRFFRSADAEVINTDTNRIDCCSISLIDHFVSIIASYIRLFGSKSFLHFGVIINRFYREYRKRIDAFLLKRANFLVKPPIIIDDSPCVNPMQTISPPNSGYSVHNISTTGFSNDGNTRKH